ncbi:PAS domain-containing protein [Streptomyces hesseae]|uniref:PAS domain-containing protein n=1 Tax=Streptomyces hesseae TaxID=3075519 RepID=A0ABU2STN7_9ACTN|nr:PAS domain-containing protein [Streptomyces sp. DSM 40473]MDT0451981.1 PAS domain-containing protein [Streptomyces sp. DSM 40473]
MSSRPSRGAARLAAILDALPDALLLVNCNGTVVNANHIALETFEVPGTGLVGRGLLDLLPEFDSRRIPGGLRAPRNEPDGGRTRPTRMIARRTDGTQFPVEVTSANLDGRTPYAEPSASASYEDELLMLVVRDLTGTMDTEAELARSQRQTEMILRAASEGVVGVDTAGKVVLVNPSAAQILGYRASDLGGRELHSLIHHSRPDGTPFPYDESPIADTLRSGRKHRVRGQVLWAKDGRAVPVDLTTAPVRDGDQLVGAVMTFTDRRPYDALAARHAQLLNLVDGSLRGPLGRLRAELGTLADDPAGQLWPEANQILHHLAAGYARMRTLVDNVLAYQRLDSGTDKLVREKVALDEVVTAGVDGAIELIGPGRAQFAVHAPAIEAEVDAERFAQALAHLIADVAGVDSTGATTASSTGSGDSTIVVAAAQRGEVVRIEVRGPFPGGDPVHGPLVRGIVRRHGGVLQTHDVPGSSGGKAYVLEVPVAADAGPVPPGAERRGPDTENLTTVMPMPTQRGRGTSPDEAPAAPSSPPEPADETGPQGGGNGRRARRGAAEPEAGAAEGGPGAAEATAKRAPGDGGAAAGAVPVPVPAPAPTGRRRGPARAEEESAERSGTALVPPQATGTPTGRRARREATAAPAEPGEAPRAVFALPPAEADRAPAAAPTGRRARRAVAEATPEGQIPVQTTTEPSVPRTAFALPPADADRKPPAPEDRPGPTDGSPGDGGPGGQAIPGFPGGQGTARPGSPGAADTQAVPDFADGQGDAPDNVARHNGPGALGFPNGQVGAPDGPGSPGRQTAPGFPDGQVGAPDGPAHPDASGAPGAQAVAGFLDGQVGTPDGPARHSGPGVPGRQGAPGFPDGQVGSPDNARQSHSGPGAAGAQTAPGFPDGQISGPNSARPGDAPHGGPGTPAMPGYPDNHGGTPDAPARPGGRQAVPGFADGMGGTPNGVARPGTPGTPDSARQGDARPGTPGPHAMPGYPNPQGDASDGTARPNGPGSPGAQAAPGHPDGQGGGTPNSAAQHSGPGTPDAPGPYGGGSNAAPGGRPGHGSGQGDAPHGGPGSGPYGHDARPGQAGQAGGPGGVRQDGGGVTDGVPGAPGPYDGQGGTPGGGRARHGVPGADGPDGVRTGPAGEQAQDASGTNQSQQAPGGPAAPAGPVSGPFALAGAPAPREAHDAEQGGEAPAPTGRRRARRALAEEHGAAGREPGGAPGARPISVRRLGQGPGAGDTPAAGTPSVGSGRRRKLANPAENEREAQAQAAQPQAPAQAPAPAPAPKGAARPQSLGLPEGRAFAIGAPDDGAEGPEPLDGPNGAVEVVQVVEAVRPPMDDELPPEPLDNPRRLLVWPAPDESTEAALTERGYRPVIVHSREEVDAQISAYPAALFVDPLTGPITRTALQSLREAAVAAEVPVLVTAGLGHATREAAYGADPAVLLKALAPRDSEMHPPRVLLIEEHEPIANALTATLERRGMHVVCGATDSEAVTLAAQTRPNLVVMDLMQVRRRRAGIVDWLRGNGALNRTPLVVYTSADIDPAQLPRLASGETVLFLAERSTSAEVQGRIVDLLAKIGTN